MHIPPLSRRSFMCSQGHAVHGDLGELDGDVDQTTQTINRSRQLSSSPYLCTALRGTDVLSEWQKRQQRKKQKDINASGKENLSCKSAGTNTLLGVTRLGGTATPFAVYYSSRVSRRRWSKSDGSMVDGGDKAVRIERPCCIRRFAFRSPGQGFVEVSCARC